MNARQLDLLQPIRQKLDAIEIHNLKLAQFLCRVIPDACPLERDLRLFGHLIVHIPPFCKLNPVYEQLVGLRFRALCYLADAEHKHLKGNNGARGQVESVAQLY